MAVGGISSADHANTVLAAGRADLAVDRPAAPRRPLPHAARRRRATASTSPGRASTCSASRGPREARLRPMSHRIPLADPVRRSRLRRGSSTTRATSTSATSAWRSSSAHVVGIDYPKLLAEHRLGLPAVRTRGRAPAAAPLWRPRSSSRLSVVRLGGSSVEWRHRFCTSGRLAAGRREPHRHRPCRHGVVREATDPGLASRATRKHLKSRSFRKEQVTNPNHLPPEISGEEERK